MLCISNVRVKTEYTELGNYLQISDESKHEIGQRLPHCHSGPSHWVQKTFYWLLSDGCGTSHSVSVGQCNHRHISQWGVEGTHALLLSHEAGDRAIHLQMKTV